MYSFLVATRRDPSKSILARLQAPQRNYVWATYRKRSPLSLATRDGRFSLQSGTKYGICNSGRYTYLRVDAVPYDIVLTTQQAHYLGATA